ncbi:efflux RND transporter periplasmic adaptor subunit [Pseudostreptobacillus hongkongensis]|uniref:efflux RND transporter periplasmic adaptor subunit n=1 Tax=Pseudostreptobacillus hongkongensis TaxID=1162717 RepID=UPI0028D3254D|nr:efflux RND transporter periplasmic adaptor subunit [Pseudostreptobacillus hongkongensis]
MTKKKKIGLAVLVLLIVCGGYGIIKLKSSSAIPSVDASQIYEVNKSNLVFNYDVDGKVESEKEVLIFSSVAGKVKNVYKRLGDEVNKDETLVILDDAGVQEMNGNIEKAQITVNQRRKEFNDLNEIYKVGGSSRSEVENARNNLKLAELDLQNIRLNSKDYSNKIVSPVSGVITEANVDENLKVDQSKYLFKIVDVENLKITAQIPNSKIKNMKAGQKVIIKSTSLPDGTTIESTISEISRISEKNTQFNDAVTKITIKLEKNSGLRPGDEVKLSIVYDELNDAVSIPIIYVETDENGKAFVYVINKENVVEKREIVLGKTNNIVYEIKSGLQAGDKVFNNLSRVYKEGDKIK